MGLVIIDVQHGCQHGHMGSKGAYGKGHHERDLTQAYAEAIRFTLLELKHEVVMYPQRISSYADRHKDANTLAKYHAPSKAVYLACHLNAWDGQGDEPDYSLSMYDERSSNGKRLARSVASSLINTSVGKSSVWACRSDDWTKNALATINGIYSGPSNISGLCLEPAFINIDAHEYIHTLQGLQEVGTQIAMGVHDYLMA